MTTIKYYLCRCNSCGNVLIDENHGQDSTLYELPINTPLRSLEMLEDKDEGGYMWACPFCETDANLMDNVSDEDAKALGAAKVN